MYGSKFALRLMALLLLVTTVAACGATPTTAPVPTIAPAATTAPAAAAATEAPAAATTAPAVTTTEGAMTDRTGWPAEFRVGLFAGDDANAAIVAVEPLRLLLEERLGLPVEITTGTSYSAVIEAMRADRVEAMEVGPFSYVLAVQEAQAEAIALVITPSDEANPVYDAAAPQAYFSTIITKKGSGIATVADLKGKTFAFVDPASTSGHLAPKTGLIKQGIDPDADMETIFAGSHPTAVLSVWEDKTEAGATFEGNLYRLADAGQIEFCGFPDRKTGIARTAEEIKAIYDSCPDGNIAIIAYSDPIPNTPFAVKSTLPPSFKMAVREALLSVKDDPALVTAYKQWYTDPTAELGVTRLDEYFNSLRDIAKLLELDLKELGG